MNISKQDLIDHAACPEGLQVFIDEWGDTEPLLADVIDYIQGLENFPDKAGWLLYLRSLYNSPKLLIEKGLAMATNNYHVFNPTIGQYETHHTKEAALKAHRAIKKQYIEAHAELFTISEEVIPDKGKPLWRKILEEDLL